MGIKTPREFKQMEYSWLLVKLAKFFKPTTYVEIGVKKCHTFNAMLPHVLRAVAVDVANTQNYVNSGYKNWEFFHMTSQDFAKKWKTPIDFLFIDGDHKMESVIADFENLFKWVLPDKGLIFLHDTYPIKKELLQDGYCSDAWKAANYLRQKANGRHPKGFVYEIVTLPGPWAGLSIIRKLSREGRRVNHGWMA